MKLKFITAGVIGAMMSASAFAETNGLYVGASTGSASYKYTDTPNSTSSTGIMAGYMLKKYFGVEVGYKNLGRANSNQGQGGWGKAEATYVDAIFALPIGESFSLFSKLGYASVKLNGMRTTTTPMSGSKGGLTAGFGAQYNFTKNVGVRVGADAYQSEVSGGGVISSAGISDVSASIVGIF